MPLVSVGDLEDTWALSLNDGQQQRWGIAIAPFAGDSTMTWTVRVAGEVLSATLELGITAEGEATGTLIEMLNDGTSREWTIDAAMTGSTDTLASTATPLRSSATLERAERASSSTASSSWS